MTISLTLSGVLHRALLPVLASVVMWGGLALSLPALAQTADSGVSAKVLAAPVVEGKTIDGTTFKLSSLKGKVVMVMFWSTGCAVCRDKMPELRNNYEGWNGKPFELVVISTDRRIQDLLDYERIITRTVPLKQRFVQLWSGESGYKDNLGAHAQLPVAYLLDKSGTVVEQYSGRIPADAWDRIADLL